MQTKKYHNKILLVDDDAKNLQVAMSILKDYNVIYAQSGEKALELIDENEFDLILLDVVMPILDGYAVCKEIKKKPKSRNTPIIFLTVKDDEKDIVKGFDEGAVDYITKPFFSAVLLKRVELHLKLSTAMRDLKDVNTNLNDIVKEQVEDIRQKEKILFQQSKIAAMSDMIDVIALQWKQPLDMIKLYIQSLQLTIDNSDVKDTLEKTLKETNKLDETMYDFQKFFKNDMEKQDVNLKVLIDNVSFLLKDQLIKQNIDLSISGDNLVSLFTAYDELKHVFIKLLTHSIDTFATSKCGEKYIVLEINEDENSIFINYKDNSENLEEHTINDILDLNSSIKNNSFDLGFYLMKVFIEKNRGILDVNCNKNGMILTIEFNK